MVTENKKMERIIRDKDIVIKTKVYLVTDMKDQAQVSKQNRIMLANSR